MLTVIDRALGQGIPDGEHWEGIFYQATHDAQGWDVGFPNVWPTLLQRGDVRGAYHFARPHLSPGAAQGKLFCDRVISLGWDHDHDIWMLDIEEGNLTGAALAQWIIEFMEYVDARLGDRGFLYIGWPYFVTHVSHTDFSILSRYRWMLPSYGPNDGQPHDYHQGQPVEPVLHQYTSVPFDKSRIIRPEVWAALVASQPAPPPPPPVTTDHGDKPVKTTDVTRKLDDHGRGYFDLPALKNTDVLAFGVIGVPDPDQGWDKVHIPVVAFTLSSPQRTPRFVLTGGAPGQTVTVRVTHV